MKKATEIEELRDMIKDAQTVLEGVMIALKRIEKTPLYGLTTPKLNASDVVILKGLEDQTRPVTTTTLGDFCGMSRTYTNGRLNFLYAAGLVVKTTDSRNKSGRPVVLWALRKN